MPGSAVLLTVSVFPLLCLAGVEYDHILGNDRQPTPSHQSHLSLLVYKILRPPGHERRSRDLDNVSRSNYENSTLHPGQSNVSHNANDTDYKSKSSTIPAISLIKDYFGNHEKNEELEDIATRQSSHDEWIDEESFSRLKYTNFSVSVVSPDQSQLDSLINSPFLVGRDFAPHSQDEHGPEEEDDEEETEEGEEEGGVRSDVYRVVHDVVSSILSKNDIESDLVSKLKDLLGSKL